MYPRDSCLQQVMLELWQQEAMRTVLIERGHRAQVWDDGMPAQRTTKTRHITIVSPCARDAYYCPHLDPICGTATCATRAALQLLPRAPPTTALTGAALAASQLAGNVSSGGVSSETAEPQALTVQAACGEPPPISLAICGAESLAADTSCGVVLADSQDVRMAGTQLVRPACTDLTACTYACSYTRALQGRCPVGRHAFRIAAVNSAQDVSNWLPVTVRTRLLLSVLWWVSINRARDRPGMHCEKFVSRDTDTAF